MPESTGKLKTTADSGLLLIDKPLNWTSFDVVNWLRGRLAAETKAGKRQVKVGHTGTLDPLATGLLVITVGAYCKRAQEFSKLDKTYEAEICLGSRSSTDDSEGEITPVNSRGSKPSEAEIKSVIASFIGEQTQTPPQFSAIKVGGQRAYKRARAGQAVELKPRPVNIYQIDNVNYRYPRLNCVVGVSSGTYIRALARDIGERLGTGAYLSGLRRTRVGQFDVTNALTIDELNTQTIADKLFAA